MASTIQDIEARLLEELDKGDKGDPELLQLLTAEHAHLSGKAGGGGGPTAGTGPALSQEQANAKLGQGVKSGAAEAVTKTVPQVGAEAVKQLLGFVMFPGELARSGVRKLMGEPADFGRATEAIHGGIDSLIAPPESKAGKRGVEIAGGGAAAAVAPGSRLRNVLTGLSSAGGGVAGQEVGQDIAGDNGRIIGGVLGSLTGGLPMAALKGSGDYRQMLSEALKGTKPGDFAEARRLQQQARLHGIDLTPEQLLPNQSGLDQLLSETLRAGGGKGELQSLVMGQPGQANVLARNTGNRLGPNVGNEQAVRDLRLSAEGAIDDVRLSGAQKALFDDKGAMLSAPQIQAADRRLGEAAKELQASEARKPLAEFRALLRKIAEYRMEPGKPVGPLQKQPTGEFRTLPLTQELVPEGARAFKATLSPEQRKLDSMKASDLDTMIKEALLKLDDLTISMPGIAKRQQGQVAGVLKDIRDILDEITPTRVAGRDMESTRHELRNALTSGLVGRVAGRHGVTEAAPDAVGTLRTTLGANVAQDKAIGELASALRTRAMQAGARGDAEGAAQATRSLPQAARVLWDEAVDKAFTNVQGRTPGDAGSILYSTLIGSKGSAKEQNFGQLIQGVAASNGQDPRALRDGFQTVLQLLNASGRNRQGLGFAAGDIRDMSGQTALRDAMRATGPLSRPQMIAEKLSLMGKERQYRQLSQIFTNPDALRILEEIGNTPIVSSRQGALMQVLFQTLQQPAKPAQE